MGEDGGMMNEEHIERAKIIINALKDYRPEQPLIGVEIGVFLGDLICALLDLEPRIVKMYGIDPYATYEDCRSLMVKHQWEKMYVQTLNRLAKYGNRVTLIRGKSEEMDDAIPMNIDFVEIDGVHTYDQVSSDIFIYERKIRKGGLLCGHDYFGKSHRQVKRAVRDYARGMGRHVFAEGLPESGMWWWIVP